MQVHETWTTSELRFEDSEPESTTEEDEKKTILRGNFILQQFRSITRADILLLARTDGGHSAHPTMNKASLLNNASNEEHTPQ